MDAIDEDPMTPFGTPVGEPTTARETVREMVDAGLLDDVMDRVDDGGLQLTGEGGFLPEMIKAVLERGLAAELSDRLGYVRGDPAGRGSPNSRNGSTPKTVGTEVGDVAWMAHVTGPAASSRGWYPRVPDASAGWTR